MNPRHSAPTSDQDTERLPLDATMAQKKWPGDPRVAKDTNASASHEPLASLSREEIVSHYLDACKQVWYGEIPAGYLARFIRRFLNR
jgi:hypothetical protein